MARAVGLLVGMAADQVFGDPKRHHPVAWFGAAAQRLEELTYRDDQTAGALHTLALLVPLAGLGCAIERFTDERPIMKCAGTAVTTWAVLGTAQLADEGHKMAELLASSDVDAARRQLPNLCGRDADQLDAPELARATIESMAENTADAGVASIFWGAVAGLPGMLVHRGANTLDAMIGHHNERYENFGACAARLDDVLDLVPARLTALLAAVCSGNVESFRIALRDHAKHPSPNGGWCEAAWAGALGVQLGGRNIYYGGRVEDRGLLGDGPRPGATDVASAAKLVTKVAHGAACIAAGGLLIAALTRQD